jgi:hypothetical protein
MGTKKNPGWRPNFIPCAVFSKRPKQEGSFQNFQNMGTGGSLISNNFKAPEPKDL